MSFRVERSFADVDRDAVARLYWQAFGADLGLVLGPEARALRFLSAVLDPRFGIVARGGDGAVLGVVGFQTEAGAFVGGGGPELRRIYGVLGGAVRAPLLSVFERAPGPGVLWMDGLAVLPQARGRGVGAALLQAVIAEAGARRLGAVQLDVSDGNTRARALYERLGFEAGAPRPLGPMGWILGLSAATRLERRV